MFSSSRLRTAGVVVASAALLTAGAQTCPANCKKAFEYFDDGSLACFECQEGYGFVGGFESACVKLPENCEYFGVTENGRECECKRGYYLDPKDQLNCLPCDNTNCDCSASDPGKCDSCVGGFGFNEDKTDCKPCSMEHCEFCGDDYTGCNTCEDGYVLDADLNCVKCNAEHCRYCITGNPSVCDACEDGYYWDEDTKSCGRCSGEGCRGCYASDNGGTCAACFEDFNFGGVPECKKCPQDNCASCSDDGETCLTCLDEGYKFPPTESKPYDCNRRIVNCRNGSHHATGTTVLLGIAAAVAALLF